MTEMKEKSTAKRAASTDVGSPEAQVSAMTARINELTDHLKVNKKDHMARRGLLSLVGKRKKLLKYLAQKDSAAYLALIKKLGLRR
ncbi:MAG TPA: 30S ribosomal protein S15 [Candidatus Saccharibacteria bacterium]|nr:30S ribosomal protein S15 [Candidatus Saccharibacteria bacterium]